MQSPAFRSWRLGRRSGRFLPLPSPPPRPGARLSPHETWQLRSSCCLDMLPRLYDSGITRCKILRRFVCPLSRPNTLPGPSHLPIDTPQCAPPLPSAGPIEAWRVEVNRVSCRPPVQTAAEASAIRANDDAGASPGTLRPGGSISLPAPGNYPL